MRKPGKLLGKTNWAEIFLMNFLAELDQYRGNWFCHFLTIFYALMKTTLKFVKNASKYFWQQSQPISYFQKSALRWNLQNQFFANIEIVIWKRVYGYIEKYISLQYCLCMAQVVHTKLYKIPRICFWQSRCCY